jgi:hypothetical protein
VAGLSVMAYVATALKVLGGFGFFAPLLFAVFVAGYLHFKGYSNSDPGAGAAVGVAFLFVITVSPVGFAVSLIGYGLGYLVKITREVDAERAAKKTDSKPTPQ